MLGIDLWVIRKRGGGKEKPVGKIERETRLVKIGNVSRT